MSTDQRPAETAAYEHRQAAAAETVSQLTAATSEHTKAMMAGTDRTDQRITPMDLPAVPTADSKHTGPVS